MRQSSPMAVLPSRRAKGSIDGVGADAHLSVDGHGFRALDGDAGEHQLASLARAQDTVRFRQFDARVDAQQFARIVQVQGLHALSVTIEDLRHIGKVQLARRGVRLDLGDVLPQQLRAKTVDAGIDDAHLKLFRICVFVFHDGRHVPRVVQNHPSVARRDRREWW